MTKQESRSTTENFEASLRENFRLSGYEARVYLALLRLGNQSPKQISSNANVPIPRVYDTLDSLMEKGFVLKSEDAYLPASPRRALHGRSMQFELAFAQEQKQRKIVEEELGRALEAGIYYHEKKSESGEISILRGFNSIANTFSELLEKSHDIFLLAKRAVEAKEIFIPILLDYSSQSKEKRIKIIFPNNAKITRKDISTAKKAAVEIRKTDHILFDMMIADSHDVIIGVPDPVSEEINHAIAIWVRNSSFASSTRRSIEETWKSAKIV